MANKGITEVKASELIPLLKIALVSGLVPLISARPGIGKSDISKQIADFFEYQPIDLRLSQLEPSDLQGMPFPNKEDRVAEYLPFSNLPTTNSKIPAGKKGWLILLDEIKDADPILQSAAYKLVLDRMVGQEHLHPNVYIIACGNNTEDNACAQPMSTALISRFVHFRLKLDVRSWLDWAGSVNADYRILAYIGFRPSSLDNFDPNSEEPYACPRTWGMVNKFLKTLEANGATLKDVHLPILEGLLGTGIAKEFFTTVSVVDKLPTYDQIIADPHRVKIPTEMSHAYLMASMVGSRCEDNEDLENAIHFCKRLRPEQQVISWTFMRQRTPRLLDPSHKYHHLFFAWGTDISNVVF